MWFLSRFRLNLLKNHILFGNSARKVVFSNHFLKSPFLNLTVQSDFQKECGFSVDSGLISTKTTFLLRILLVKIVFSNHYFQIWLIRADFQKECVFLCRYRLNLIKNHVPFENSAREGGFLKAPESRLCRFIDFHNECGF